MFTRSKLLASRFAPLLVLATLLGACAQIPRSTVSESQFAALSCPEIATEMAVARATHITAEQAKSDSWHAVLPFVVAARYVDAGSASTEAQRRIDLLKAQAAQRGCAG
jgi:hypothetical protein